MAAYMIGSSLPSLPVPSCTHSDAAAFSVLVEQPMLAHFGLRNSAAPEGIALVADLIVSLHTVQPTFSLSLLPATLSLAS